MTTGKLIVVTGVHQIVGNVFSKITRGFESTPYFISNINNPEPLGTTDIGNNFFKDLLELENKRNDDIKNHLKIYPVVIVEEWHLGVTAWAKAQKKPLADTCFKVLERMIKEIGKANLYVWFVSTDPEKRMPNVQIQYNLYLTELGNLISHLNLRCDNIDGEDLPSSIEKRISFLLDNLLQG